jgi:hypothetical protein
MVFTHVFADEGDTIKTIYLNNAVIIAAQRTETNSFDRSESIGYLEKSQLRLTITHDSATSLIVHSWCLDAKDKSWRRIGFIRGLLVIRPCCWLMVSG